MNDFWIGTKANAIGRSSKTVKEFLEKNWAEGLSTEESIKLTVRSLLEVVQTGAKNIELSIMDGFGSFRQLSLNELEAVVSEIEKEKEVEQQRLRDRRAATAASQAAMGRRAGDE
ncbi:Proteasome subunit alpha type-4 [Puccinia graminis f. sp. tritici]|uniref:Proteasome subunit alpha type-4 n=1 Tax=Puccinia graminis f. sp. tritici TaxID=56615 RepID=A0A5B0S8M2_PUCGR|nr:Proteasome subunit alpha type-4 [Puccinia graminis f. sp. tritici]